MATTKRTAPPKTKKGMAKKPRLTRQGGLSFEPTAIATPEKQNVDVSGQMVTTAGSAAFVAPAAAQLLNGLTQGNAPAANRKGRKVLMKSLDVKWNYILNGASGGADGRIVIFYDKQSNAAAPAVLDVMTTDNFLSSVNLSNNDRFVILANEYTTPINTGGNPTISGRIFRKLNNAIAFNNGNAGTIADITTGSIYIIFAQNGTGITAGGPALSFYSRIRYIDM